MKTIRITPRNVLLFRDFSRIIYITDNNSCGTCPVSLRKRTLSDTKIFGFLGSKRILRIEISAKLCGIKFISVGILKR